MSRGIVQARTEQLRALNECSAQELKLLLIGVGGIVVDARLVVGAIGVDEAGDKHLLGVSRAPARTRPRSRI